MSKGVKKNLYTNYLSILCTFTKTIIKHYIQENKQTRKHYIQANQQTRKHYIQENTIYKKQANLLRTNRNCGALTVDLHHQWFGPQHLYANTNRNSDVIGIRVGNWNHTSKLCKSRPVCAANTGMQTLVVPNTFTNGITVASLSCVLWNEEDVVKPTFLNFLNTGNLYKTFEERGSTIQETPQ